jgi:signal transduction histidine kinase
MARGDFPSEVRRLNLQGIAADLRCILDRSQARSSEMRVVQAIDVHAASPTEIPVVRAPPDDGIMLADGAGVALGRRHAFTATVRPALGVRGGGSVRLRRVEIPLLGGHGEVSGVLCRTIPVSESSGALVRTQQQGPGAVEAVKVILHDINNVLAVVDGGLRQLEQQRNAARREEIVGMMQRAVARGAVLCQRVLEATPPQTSADGQEVAGRDLAGFADALAQELRDDVVVRNDIDPELWDFQAQPEEIYFALLNLCRNAADAMPECGTVTVSAQNLDPLPGSAQGFVELSIADGAGGISKEVLLRAFEPYFTTKASGRGTDLGLAQVARFVERQGGAIQIESEPGCGTLVRLLLPRAARVGGSVRAVVDAAVGTEIAYTPSPSGQGGAFHIVSSGAGARLA